MKRTLAVHCSTAIAWHSKLLRPAFGARLSLGWRRASSLRAGTRNWTLGLGAACRPLGRFLLLLLYWRRMWGRGRRNYGARHRGRQRRFAVIEAVGHAVRRRVSLVERRQTKEVLAELREADVRVLDLRDVPSFSIRTEHQAWHTASIAKLGAVSPQLHFGRVDMVIPAAPVVPRNEDGGRRP